MTTLTGDGFDAILDGHADLSPGFLGGVVPHRLPAAARSQHADLLLGWGERCPMGVTLRFTTSSTLIRLTMQATVAAITDADPATTWFRVRSGSGSRVLPFENPSILRLDPVQRIPDLRPQPARTYEIEHDGSDTPVEILLPHASPVELISLEALDVRPAPAAGPRWIHYGSSISHCMDSPTPDRTWPTQVADALGWRLRSLAFAGNAQLDQFSARVIRDSPADIITLKLGINLVNADSMRARTFTPAVHGFLDTVRDGHPDTPIVVISAISCPIHEDHPGPVAQDAQGAYQVATRQLSSDEGALTLSTTRDLLAAAVTVRQASDPRLALIDGRDFFGPGDIARLHDNLHPDQAGTDLIAGRVTAGLPAALASISPTATI